MSPKRDKKKSKYTTISIPTPLADKLKKRIIGFDPTTKRIMGFKDNRILFTQDSNIEERVTQLSSLYEALGDCTKAIYKRLGSKPKDLWITSVFIHLLLNSMDYSGPDPSSEEDFIRKIPPL